MYFTGGLSIARQWQLGSFTYVERNNLNTLGIKTKKRAPPEFSYRLVATHLLKSFMGGK